MIPENHVYRAQGEDVMNFVTTDIAGEHRFGIPPAAPGISIRFVSNMALGLWRRRQSHNRCGHLVITLSRCNVFMILVSTQELIAAVRSLY